VKDDKIKIPIPEATIIVNGEVGYYDEFLNKKDCESMIKKIEEAIINVIKNLDGYNFEVERR